MLNAFKKLRTAKPWITGLIFKTRSQMFGPTFCVNNNKRNLVSASIVKQLSNINHPPRHTGIIWNTNMLSNLTQCLQTSLLAFHRAWIMEQFFLHFMKKSTETPEFVTAHLAVWDRIQFATLAKLSTSKLTGKHKVWNPWYDRGN